MKPPSASPAGTGLDVDPAVDHALRSLDRAVTAGAADRIAQSLDYRRRRRRHRRLALGAAAVCAVSAWLLLPLPAPTDRAPSAPLPATAVVFAPATRILPDGSTAESRPDARFDLEFSPTLRRVVLRAGEAHFDVQKDPARPFVVVAGEVEVRAVGTAFSVALDERTVAVLVTEGRVALAAPSAQPAAGSPPPVLAAGTRAVVARADPAAAAPRIGPVTPAEASGHLGWRVRRIEFSGTPLAEAVPLFNRHAGTRLALDPALGGLRLSGTLRADDLDALLLLLRGEFGIAAETRPDGSVGLHRR